MPSVLLSQSIAVEFGASEPWPADAKLFQSYEVEQILLPDSATCLATQAFLKMCGLNFAVEMRANAESMSPLGIHISDHLDNAQRADMRAYMSLINNVLANAELYICWMNGVTLEEVTKPRYGAVYPWPLNHILAYRKQLDIRRKLSALGWVKKTVDEVYTEIDTCCHALSERLDKLGFFFNNKPTELDALVFGHLFTILTTPLPDNRLAAIVRSYRNLVDLCKNIEQRYFERQTEDFSFISAPPLST
uniref:Metaxin glutathione S-transferase domain-containing protein n=1 Tax=Strigamia maritima TaxID=126957 RepID=T1JEZ3_STRMM